MIFIPRTVSAERDDTALALRARDILSRRCFQCHGANGSARKNIFVLDRERLISSKAIVPGDANSLLLAMVESNAMPMEGPALSDEEKAALRNWVIAGAPRWNDDSTKPSERLFMAETIILALIRDDLLRAPGRSRQFLRYFSLAHLYNAGVSSSELDVYRATLAKLINSLSWHREITAPAAIDPARTLYRVDLRDYNWTAETWNRITAAYPYAVRTQESDIIARLTNSSVAYVRADWFAANASAPPLYHDILGLPRTVQELEKMIDVDAARDFDEEKNVVRAGVRASGVSANNRVLERHASPYGAYWKSFDFRTSAGAENIFNNPISLTPAGGEMIFNLPNGLQAYFIADGRGNRIDRAPIEIVADRNNPDEPVIQNGRSCMSCHYGGMQSFKDDMRALIESAAVARFDQDKALALYPEQAQLDHLTEKDRERFRSAVAQLGADLPTSAITEPINQLARRFASDLSVAQAAAEAGMRADEFQERLRASAQLIASGFGQLLAARGGIKRDQWEKNFGAVVREMRLGDALTDQTVSRATFTATASPGSQSFNRDFNREPRRSDAINANPVEIMKTARTIFVWSGTVYLNADRFEDELRKRPEFQAMGLVIVKEQRLADLEIDLGRPLFTFTFTYNVTSPAASILVTSGKVTAFDGGGAAPKIAKELLKRIQAARTGQEVK